MLRTVQLRARDKRLSKVSIHKAGEVSMRRTKQLLGLNEKNRTTTVLGLDEKTEQLLSLNEESEITTATSLPAVLSTCR